MSIEREVQEPHQISQDPREGGSAKCLALCSDFCAL